MTPFFHLPSSLVNFYDFLLTHDDVADALIAYVVV